MIAPTERSMPAVRMTIDCAAAEDADDRDLLQDQATACRRRRSCPLARPKISDRQEQHDQRHSRRRSGMKPVLDAAGGATVCSSSKLRDGLWTSRCSGLESCMACDVLLPAAIWRPPPTNVWRRPLTPVDGCGAEGRTPRAQTLARRRPQASPSSAPGLWRCRSTRQPSTGLSVTRTAPVSKKVLALRGTRASRRSRRTSAIASMPIAGHQQRILLRGGADDALGDVLTPGQPPSTDTISDVASPARPP